MEELYGVCLGGNRQNYAGRDREGRILTTLPGDGRLMTKDCAESLCRVFRSRYPNVHVVELFRGDKDEVVAESLKNLGEHTGIEDLAQIVKECLAQGYSRAEIFATVHNAVQG